MPGNRADRLAYAFYGSAAAAALVGQVWAGIEHIPWPEGNVVPLWLQVALVAPAVGVIELGGVATSALADSRRRLGEQATAYRVMSALTAVVAVAFNVVGHWKQPYLAIGFGGLSAFAYVLWLAHSGARWRDAQRAAGRMERTTPIYGLAQWKREPKVTALARSLAAEHGYGLHESLHAAREEIRAGERRKAIAACIEDLVRAGHEDPMRAKLAITTFDMDRLAREIEGEADYAGWAASLAPALRPPTVKRAPVRKPSKPAMTVPGDVKVEAPKLHGQPAAEPARLHAVPDGESLDLPPKDADDSVWVAAMYDLHMEQTGREAGRGAVQALLRKHRNRGMNQDQLASLLREEKQRRAG